MSHILILDIGKTNKKAFVFDEDYRIVHEKSTVLPETVDDDRFPCEDLEGLTYWIEETTNTILAQKQFHIRAINVSAYGASFVHLSENGKPVAPLYNYLKPFPEDLKKQFYDTYGSEEKLALETASPALGSLNSGLQLYWLKYRKPLIFNSIKWSLHLPQYVSWVIGRKLGWFDSPQEVGSDITSIGCHTMLWDFHRNDYHHWVKAEGMTEKFPPIASPPKGLHDSSAALIPFLTTFKLPFVPISTGTWCISLNPFNQWPLTPEELAQDCLFYNSYTGNPVKAARYFGGYEHEQAVKKMAEEFGVETDFYKNINLASQGELPDAYRHFMRQLVDKQAFSTKLVIENSKIRRIFVDGGFSKNEIYMRLLAETFPEMEVCAAEVAQATALGAALAIHKFWNDKEIPAGLVKFARTL